MEFDAIAAVVVGGTSFDKGKGGLPGTLLGVIAVGVLKNGLNLASVASATQVTMIGLFVILAVLVDGRRRA
jgi:ribose transport system permease protein